MFFNPKIKKLTFKNKKDGMTVKSVSEVQEMFKDEKKKPKRCRKTRGTKYE